MILMKTLKRKFWNDCKIQILCPQPRGMPTKNTKKDEKKKKDKDQKEEVKPVKIDLNNIEDRKIRLTIHSSFLSDAVISPDGKAMYYLSKGENGYDLWMHDFEKKETKMLVPLKSKSGGDLFMDEKGENLVVATRASIMKIGIKEKKPEPVSFIAEFYLDEDQEREYMFEHVWRQVKKKFYDPENKRQAGWTGLSREAEF